jgi:SAM-dependent methyltransferase
MGDFPSEFGRSSFLALVDDAQSVLELGPFVNPCLSGPNVKYFDVLDKTALLARAMQISLDVSKAVDIDFVSDIADMSVVNETFDVVVSSHSIEHNPDLIDHLKQVERILKPGGRYLVIVPDKRYCFDHFLPESSIAEILDARGRTRHSLASIIEHRAQTTHNDAARHWNGDHGAPLMANGVGSIVGAIAEYQDANGAYIDVHAWQFTPESVRSNVKMVKEIGLISLVVERLYPTVHGSNEFCAVLRN